MRTVFVAESDGEARRVLDTLRAEAPRVGPNAPPALARAAEGRLEDRVLVGTASRIDDRIAEYRERLGMDLLVARTEIAGTPPEARIRTLDHLATLQN
jgi:alkanesulfonate monooxygenase SsuD/methylene tetrahydromethanopterin reductase-like flavin-dependent oxidoreductase (luciferase family)